MPSVHNQHMIKFITSIWQRLFLAKEPEPEDTRPVKECPRCGWVLGLKIVIKQRYAV